MSLNFILTPIIEKKIIDFYRMKNYYKIQIIAALKSFEKDFFI